MSLLSVNHLKKSFVSPSGENIDIVDVDNFTLASSEFCGMRGESGSGKTTFLHLLAGILSPDDGSIQIDGKNLQILSSSAKDRLRAGTVGYVFQSFNLLQGFSCIENLKLAMSFCSNYDESYAEGLLEKVGLAHRLSYKPSQLSIGQQQRVALARALVNKPKLVLADEPTGNLDSKSGHEIMKIFDDLHRNGNTIILVTHEDDIAKHSNRVVRLLDGKIVKDEIVVKN